MSVLGVHNAHDAGAAIVHRGEVLSAVNEERFTRRKNDVGFPMHSIRHVIGASECETDFVAVPWIGGSALVSRIFPGMEEKRRRLWRKEGRKQSRTVMHLSNALYNLTLNQEPRWFWRGLGKGLGGSVISKRLAGLGINKRIRFVEHHAAHAASAYYSSGFKEALVITLDGAGDGLSGSVSTGDNGDLKRINEFKASASLGVLYGAATLACDMRYSEDEGKLMSLAAYSYPAEIPELSNISRYDERARQLVSGSRVRYEFLLAEYMKDHILWKYNREAFAYAVQKHLEEQVLKIVRQHIKETGIRNIAVAGGIFSNIIVNMLINEMAEVKDLFVFPQMGDGGLALGSAYYVDFQENGTFNRNQVDSIYYGPEYGEGEIEDVLKKYKKKGSISYERKRDIASHAADVLAEDKIVLWFQGRMEYGPRALGNRSVLALPNNPSNRDEANMIIKKRPYFQPFASTMLEEEAKALLSPCKGKNRFMTVGYRVKPDRFGELVAASHIDMTTRPQMLGKENPMYRNLLLRIKKKTGTGALLNTSFNKHGMPIVMTPEDALWTLENTGARYLAIGNFFVEKKGR